MENKTQKKNPIKRIKNESKIIRGGIKKQMLSYIMAAFGLVAGLAWNDAVKSLIEFVFPTKQNTLMAKFLYALLITLVVVLITIYLSRILSEKEEE
jgi:hypothetical protein